MNENSKNELNNLLIFSKRSLSIFKEIPFNKQGFVLLGLPKNTQKRILNKLKNQEIIRLLHYLDPSGAVNLLRNIKKDSRRNKIITELKKDIKDKVEFLLKFDPKTAAGLMNLSYIEVDKNLKIKDILKLVKGYEKKMKRFPEILVVEDGLLLGELEAHSLFLPSNRKVENYVRKVPTIEYNKSEKEIIKFFKKNPHKQIVVLDEDKSILGIIYSDDILELINKETVKSLSSFAGVSEEEDVYDSALTKVKNRYKWLIINLFTAFLAALVVSLFEETISAFVLLAIYMPVVAGMGGNAGTQTLAVVVRGIALRKIEIETAKRVIFNEILAGAINGVITGLIVAFAASLFNKNPLLGLVVGMAMVINLMIAGFFGTIIPLIMKRLKKDPASSATIFITTATDVLGFFVFLGLARILLV